MNPRQYQKVMQVVDDLMDCAPDKLEARIKQECAGDEELRCEVLKLFVQDKPNSAFLEESPLNALSNLKLAEEQDHFIGQRVGPYRITEEIGHGGMGAVYKALRDDDQYSTEVAIKLIKRGMDTEAILRRFVMERQILANLNHPNIARLLDGGTTEDGLPYFVMEHIKGQPINQYCDALKLSTTERLKLFRTVCSALSYAHQNLVIHRDLKPSNMLVTADGTVKLLDFGIAKLLDSEAEARASAVTATALRAMTPEYASPEQVKGEQITTASDVYSLGVLLYELLTGHRPYSFKSRGADEVARVISKVEPERPSTAISRVEETKASDGEGRSFITPESVSEVREGGAERLRRRLQGDIDNIVLKALRKEPERRYNSVEQLSEDIRRHLEGLPVRARKATLTYRTQKFVQRHRAGVLAASLIVAALIVGMAATLWQARVARAEHARAERRFNDVRRLANSFMFEFHDAIKDLSGAMPARQLVVSRALEYLDGLAQEAGDDPALRRELATAYERIGKIQGNAFFSNLGDTPGAMASYQKSLEIRLRLHQADPTNREIQHELAASYEGVGDMFYTDNDLTNGLQNYEQALALRLRLVEAEPQNRKYLHALAELHTRSGLIKGTEGYANLGDTLGALDEHTRAVAIAEKLGAVEPNEEAQVLLAGNLISLAMQQNALGKSAEALANGRKAVATYETLAGRNPNNARIKEYLMTALTVLRYSLIDENLLPEAEKNARYVLAETEKAAAADPKDVNWREDLSISYNDLARVLREGGKAREAIALHERALQIIEKLAADSPSGELQTTETQTRRFLALAQLDAGDYAAALANFERCAEASEKDLVKSPENVRTKDDLAIAYTGIGSALARMKQWARAVEYFNRAVPLAEDAARKSPHNVKVQSRLAKTYFEGGRNWKQLARAAGDGNAMDKSCGLLRKSFDVWEALRQKQLLSKLNHARADEVSRELRGCQ